MGEKQEEPKATWRVEKGRLHRKRVKTFPNGNVYNCEFVGDKPDGYGTFTSQGMKYEGNFLNGLFHGAAKIVWTDESNRIVKTFKGEFKCGQRFGYGVLSDDIEKWEGNFANDKFHGEGTLWKKDGDRLKGEWKNGKFQCKDGLIVFRNGDKYEGPVHHGQLHGGVGHYSYRDGGSYTGHYSYNVPNGIGTRTFVDGTTFRGDFRNGKFHGHGIMTYENGLGHKKQYNGDWIDGMFDGCGELCFQKSSHVDFYKGNFKSGKFHTQGHLQYRDGSFYEGEFHEGHREGRGKRMWTKGNWFEGNWERDSMISGRYFDTFANSTYVGTFERNKKHGSGKEIWRSQANIPFRDQTFGWSHAVDGVCKYDGEYLDGYFDGQGRFEVPDGRYFDGAWRLGKPHGFGTMHLLRKIEYGDAARMHIGRFGSLYRPNKFSGEWRNGKRHGQGTLFFLDGSSKEVVYNDGTIIVQKNDEVISY